MGLAGPKISAKISKDPRNTHWATNTTRFGHRLLTTYGWTPGQTLGNTSSTHHKHLTSASRSTIKIHLKDDNLGIGAKKGSKDDECTGLDFFQDVLGRLNGKSEGEIGKAAQARERQKQVAYVERRFGMKFVLGGVYVSTETEGLVEGLEKSIDGGSGKGVGSEEKAVREEKEEALVDKKSRKRKREVTTEKDEEEEEASSEKQSRKKSKKEKSKKTKRDKKAREKSKKDSTAIPSTSPSSPSSPPLSSIAIPSPPQKKDPSPPTKNRKIKKQKTQETQETPENKKKKKKKKNKASTSSSTPPASASIIPTPTPSRSTPQPPQPLTFPTGRHALRVRYISAKKSAVMDEKALNEIFMIKAAA